jgi:hypothetical protein
VTKSLRSSTADDLDDIAGGLIEGLDRGQVSSPGQRRGLAQNAFVPIRIDIEPKDLAAKLAVHDDAARRDGRLRFSAAGGD